jgi:hypothetical protein
MPAAWLQLDSVYIRGSKMRFLQLPEMLKNAPMFKAANKAASVVRAGGERSVELMSPAFASFGGLHRFHSESLNDTVLIHARLFARFFTVTKKGGGGRK